MPLSAILQINQKTNFKKELTKQFGRQYLPKLRHRYPESLREGETTGMCSGFRRAHDHLPDGGRAGLIGTNTIRQNTSREGGLDYIVKNGGTITEAISTQVWPGEAVVHVSTVNWIKGSQAGKKKLKRQLGDRVDGPWEVDELDADQFCTVNIG